MQHNSPVPFENFDNNHCLQVSLMGVLTTLGHPVRQAEIDKATGWEKGLWTWTIPGAAVAAKFVPGVRLLSPFDFRRFADEGEAYLKTQWSPQRFRDQRAHASPNFAKEQQAAKQFMTSGTFELRKPPTADEMTKLLKDYIIVPQVDYGRLYRGQANGGSHYIVVYAAEGENFWLNDSGLPMKARLRHPKQMVQAAMTGDVLLIPHGGRKFGPL
jgi:hypothetical protein